MPAGYAWLQKKCTEKNIIGVSQYAIRHHRMHMCMFRPRGLSNNQFTSDSSRGSRSSTNVVGIALSLGSTSSCSTTGSSVESVS